ncbi:hypothetical protein RRG08_009539 [Elysia crispata]|uniref:Uncharacterized protein n=1 Tax=Elysia crispata TaxID=231223 RepID=A0AAE1B267_9GAST|nr:hypothetical protein RRG08_009539 [Elysia crispata]
MACLTGKGKLLSRAKARVLSDSHTQLDCKMKYSSERPDLVVLWLFNKFFVSEVSQKSPMKLPQRRVSFKGK